MDFLKKHYEKLVLGLVLLGLAIAAAVLPIKINNEREGLEKKKTDLIHPKVVPLTNLDLSGPEEAMKLMATPAFINFSEPNKLFNPMPWQKAPDGRLVRADRVGPSALSVTNLTPLYLRLSLDSITVLETGNKYVIGVQKEADPIPGHRVKKASYCTVNPPTKTDTFTMLEVKGNPAEPSQVIVMLNDTGERAVITRENPFKRADGYMADIKYELERKSWKERRVGNSLSFNGEDYNIVAINQNEVVLSASRNQKKWTIKYNPGP